MTELLLGVLVLLSLLRLWLAAISPGAARRYRCNWCECDAYLYCDWQVAEGRECGARMCHRHRLVDGEHDYCPLHQEEAARELGLNRSTQFVARTTRAGNS